MCPRYQGFPLYHVICLHLPLRFTLGIVFLADTNLVPFLLTVYREENMHVMSPPSYLGVAMLCKISVCVCVHVCVCVGQL